MRINLRDVQGLSPMSLPNTQLAFMLDSGVYVHLHPTTGRLYKVGSATYLLKRFRQPDYTGWLDAGEPVVADVYPIPGIRGRHSIAIPEMVLRGRLIEDGWVLSSDGTFEQTRPQGTGQFYVTRDDSRTFFQPSTAEWQYGAP
jgi:hypothetical protein